MHKKLFAMLLAVVLVSSFVSIAAFAEGNSDPPVYLDPNEENTFSLPIRYKINQTGSVNPKTKLYFECRKKSFKTDPDDENPLSDLEMTFPEIGIQSITFGAGDASLEGAVMDAVFEIPAISQVGIYEYTYEMIPDHQAVYMDYPIFTLQIFIFYGPDPGEKKMAVGVQAMSDEQTPSDPEIGDPAETFKLDELEIEYRAYSYSITKEVDGYLGDRDSGFEFTVTLAGSWEHDYIPGQPDHNEAEGYPHVTISYSGGEVNGSFELESEITTNTNVSNQGTEDEYTTYTHSFEKEIEFSLKDGQTVTFTNIPETVTVTTTEADYSGDGYVTTIGSDVKRTEQYTVSAPNGNGSVTVVNTKDRTPDTGVILDNLPYIIAVVLVVSCGIAFFVIKRRRRSDDYYDDEA